MKIKIIHLVDDLNIGGLERSLAIVVKNLDKAGYEAGVWCLLGAGRIAEELTAGGVEVKIMNFSNSDKIRGLFRIAGRLRREKIGIVHCWGLSAGVWGRLASIIAGIPVRLVHAQNLYDDLRGKDRLVEYILNFFTDKIIACSEAVKRSVMKFTGIRESKIKVIYNCVEIDRFGGVKNRESIRREFGLADKDIVIGMVSRLVPVKGHIYLLRAAIEVLKEFPHVKFLIVGDGPLRARLMNMANELCIEKSVVFAGLREDVPDILSAVDIFVQPSIIKEGMPLAIAEALASGIPVVATDVGGNAEIVHDGKTGLLVPQADAGELAKKLIFLLRNPPTAKEMGRAGRLLCEEKFSSAVMVKKIEDLYDSFFPRR